MPTHKVLKDKSAQRPFSLDDFHVVEFGDRVPSDMEVVLEGSHEECSEFVDKSVPVKRKTPKKKTPKK